MDPERQRLLGMDVGPPTLALAPRGVPHVAGLCAPPGVPRWVTDGRKASGTALLPPVGDGRPPERRQTPGPRPQPRWMPRPQCLAAQVGPSSRRRRRVRGPHRVVVGPMARVQQGLGACGRQLHPAWVARRHRDLRPRGGGAAGADAGPRRRRLPASAGGVPGLSPGRAASRARALGTGGAGTTPRHRFGHAGAAVSTGQGRRSDRSRLDAARGAAVSGAAVAAASGGVRRREPERERRVAVR
jgi:hypothetical protein